MNRVDPSGGDGPNKGVDPSEGEHVSGPGAAHQDDKGQEGHGRRDEGGGGHEGGGRHEGGQDRGGSPKSPSASKGINPVQHSE